MLTAFPHVGRASKLLINQNVSSPQQLRRISTAYYFVVLDIVGDEVCSCRHLVYESHLLDCCQRHLWNNESGLPLLPLDAHHQL